MKKILSFLIPLIILIIAFFFCGVFTENSFLYSDSTEQYYQLLFYFKNVLTGATNIFYSFSKGIGGSMISTYAYYLASPLNLLLYFFNNIYAFYIVITITKLSLCGTTMYYYLNYHFKDKPYLLLFSTAYALSLFNIGNYFQIMWLDCIMLSPLILLGVDKIVNEKKPLLYGISLFLAILSNYYMGYIICLFSVLYFVYRLLLSKIDKKKIFMFLTTSFLSGMMTMFVNIPNILTMFGNRNSKYYIGFFNTDIPNILSKLFIGSIYGETFINPYASLLYCGLFMLPLLILYFINRKINKRERILSLIFLLVLVVSILFGPINNVWHLFSPPNCFNARYTFLFIILIIYLSCKNIYNMDKMNNKKNFINIIFIIIGIIVFIGQKLPLFNIIISIILYAIYVLMYINFKGDIKKIFYLLAISELFFNTFIVLNSFDFYKQSSIDGRYNEVKETISYLTDDDFYRIEFIDGIELFDGINKNYSYYTNYRSSSSWLSTISLPNSNLKKLGFISYNNSYNYVSYPVNDALLGIKYLETKKTIDYDKIYTHKISASTKLFGISYIDSYLYYNPYYLNIGYAVNNDYNLTDNIFDNQNNVIKNMTGLTGDVYTQEDLSKNDGVYSYKIKNNRDFYIEVKVNSNKCDYVINVNGEKIKNKSYESTIYIKNNYKIGDTINITSESDCSSVTDILLYSFNKDNFIDHVNILKQNELNITEFRDGYIKGNINGVGKVFTSIPYEKGWNIKVNGVKVDYYKLYDTFIGFDINGESEIEMIYYPPGLNLGIIISSISFICFNTYMIYIYKKKTIID